MNGLPEGWLETRVDTIAPSINYGYTAKSSSSAEGPKYLRITDIQDGRVNWDGVPRCEPPMKNGEHYVLRAGDLVFARTGATTGKSFLIQSCPEAVFASYLIRVRPSPAVLPKFLSLFFQSHSYWQQISENISGSAQPNCNASKLSALLVPIPALEEQHRIVEKVEALLAKVRASQERLDKIPRLLKRFRQAVLAAACSGKLTADWRQERGAEESGQTVVQKLETARANTHDATGGRRARTSTPVEVLQEEEWPEVIPDTWVWVGFGSVIGELKNGVSPRPNIEPPGLPLLRISAARPGSVDLTDIRYLPNAAEFLPAFALHDDDLLFTRYNGSIDLLGVCGMVRDLGQRTFLYPDKLMRVRFDHDFVLPGFAEVFFQTAGAHERLVAKSKSSAGQNGVSGTDVKLQAFALPPVTEQREIVRRVESMLHLADRLQSRYEKATRHTDKLTQSILAKAFRGELVPTEAALARKEGRSYETAEELLARIKTANAAQNNGRKTSSRARRKRVNA